jgi:putative spermidine/putrescine transport system permease protein
MRGHFQWRALALGTYNLLFFVFLISPLLVVVLVSINDTQYISFPLKKLTLRWFRAIPEYMEFIDAFMVSLWVALLTAIGSTVVGTMAAFALVRGRFPGRDTLNTLVMSPLTLPGVVTGIAMLQFYTWLYIGPSLGRLVLGHTIITIPYVVRQVSAVLYGFPRSVEDAAMSLGASRLRTTFLITFPMIRSGLLAGAIFSFIVSFDNVVISIFLVSPEYNTLPIAIFNFVQFSAEPIIAAISTIQMIVIILLIVIMEKFMSFSRYV